MTLAAGVKTSYSGDGVTVAFPVTFIFWDDSDVQAIHRDAAGAETTWVDGTQYNLTGGSGSTGTLTVVTSPTDYTPAAGETLVVKSNRALTQGQALPLGGELPSTTVEQMIDQVVRLVQQSEEALSRSIKFSETSPDSDVAFPDVTGNASRLLAVNSGATALELVTLASLSVSSLDTLITSEAEDDFLMWNAVSSMWENETLADTRTALDSPQLAAANTFTADQTIQEIDGTTTVYGPELTFYRQYTTAAIGDLLGALTFRSTNSASESTIYAQIGAWDLIPTDGAEYGLLVLRAMYNGTLDDRFFLGAGLYSANVGGATADKGADTINVSNYYRDGVEIGRSHTDSIATTSGATRDITGIPTEINEIIISLEGVSQDTAGQTLILQLGDSGGFETSGYSGANSRHAGASTHSQTANSAGFILATVGAATLSTGQIRLVHMGSNIWSCMWVGDDDATTDAYTTSGNKTLTGELTQVRLTTAAGSALFDAGVMYLRATN